MPLEHPLLDQLHRALRSEEDHERREAERIASLPWQERVALGWTWAPVELELEDTVSRRSIRVLVRGVLHDGIRPGDTVEVGELRGRCVGWEPRVAELILRGTEDQWASAFTGDQVSKVFDPSSLIRYRQALERADVLESPLKTALLEADLASEPILTGWKGLNDAQIFAAGTALGAAHLAVIHGPPGTGKTRTLAVFLERLVTQGLAPWALAESNAAVDHLALAAAARGLMVVRVGPTFRMSSEAAKLSLDHRVENGDFRVSFKKLDREIKRLRRTGGPALWSLLDDRRALTQRAREDVLSRAEVIATTLGTMANRAGEFPPAHTAVLDEVTQALEPAVWAAVPFVERLVLAGDPHQLGPYVTEPGNMLADGLLTRLQQRAELPMLTTQYRMNQQIQSLVAGIYGPTYQPHGCVADRHLHEQPPVLWIDTAGAGEERRDPITQSTYNLLEVELVARVLRSLRAREPHISIGVIAPYAAQVQRLSQLAETNDVEVATVNAFQGREADAIVVSFTRSNLDGILGFVADRRRLTVAITRAKQALVLIGDSSTLTHSPMFAELMGGAQVQSVWESPWAEVLASDKID